MTSVYWLLMNMFVSMAVLLGQRGGNPGYSIICGELIWLSILSCYVRFLTVFMVRYRHRLFGWAHLSQLRSVTLGACTGTATVVTSMRH